MENENALRLTREDVLVLLSAVGNNSTLLNLAHKNLEQANLAGLVLFGANLVGTNLRGVNLVGANLRRVELDESDLASANLAKSDLLGTTLINADLRGADLSEADLRGANLLGANLRGANLYRANLLGADLRGADLRRAELTEANLTNANLLGTDLRGTVKDIYKQHHIGKNLVAVKFKQDSLSARTFASTLLAITTLHTKLYLLATRRYDDLTNYTKTGTGTSALDDEAGLIITRLYLNSPDEIALISEPKFDSVSKLKLTADLASPNLAEAITEVLRSGVVSILQVFSATKTLPELTSVSTTELETAPSGVLEVAKLMVKELCPETDQETRALFASILLPQLLTISNELDPLWWSIQKVSGILYQRSTKQWPKNVASLVPNSKGKLSSLPPIARNLPRKLAADLGIAESLIYRWRKQLNRHAGDAFPGKGNQLPQFAPKEYPAGKKSAGHFLTTADPQVKFKFIREHAHLYPIALLCKLFSVSQSGFYAWQKRKPSRHSVADQKLTEVITGHFEANREVYGSPRIHVLLKEQGTSCSRKRVARLMATAGLRATRKPAKRAKPAPSVSLPNPELAKNLLNREFTAAGPNQKWVGDITQVWTYEGWLYLAALLDLYSRRVVGWAMSAQIDEKLVQTAFTMAREARQPGAGLLHHSDRGSQYTSLGYQTQLARAGSLMSLSRKGNCYDNACMESFFGTLKEECTKRQTFKTRREARQAIFEYIEVFYNRKRLHSSIGYKAPVEYEKLNVKNN